MHNYTVEPPNKGHIESKSFVERLSVVGRLCVYPFLRCCPLFGVSVMRGSTVLCQDVPCCTPSVVKFTCNVII